MLRINIRQRRLKNGELSLYLDCRDGQRRWYESTGLVLVPESTEEDRAQNRNALANAVKIKSERLLGKQRETSEESNTKDSGLTLSDYMELYFKRKSENDGLSDSHKKHLQCFHNFLIGYLGHAKKANLRMKNVGKAFLKDLLRYIKEEFVSTKSPKNPKLLSPSTQHLYQQYLSAMFNQAVRDGVLDSNPMGRLEKSEKKIDPINPREFLTREEVKSLIGIDTGAPVTRDAFLFCCFTGLRFSDVSSLTWSQIKSGASGQYISVMMTKTKKIVNVPIGRMAMSFMPMYEEQGKEERVFPIAGLSSVERALKRMAAKATIQKDMHFHMSRHTFATLSLAAGVDIATVSSILGHTTIRTTQLYAKVLMDAQVAAIDSLPSYGVVRASQ